MNRTAVKSLVRVLAYLYPLSIWILHDRLGHKALGFVLLGILTLDWLLTVQKTRRVYLWLAVAGLLALIVTLGPEHSVRLYPLLVAGSVLHIFLRTRRPEDNPMIGPMRRFIKLDDELLALLYKARVIWIVGLSLNCAVFVVLLFAFDTKTWALYSSFYSYLLLVFLFLLTVTYVGIKRKRLL